jgi:hypothetical protein
VLVLLPTDTQQAGTVLAGSTSFDGGIATVGIGVAAPRGSDTLGGVTFIGFGIVVVGVGVVVLLLSNVPLGAVVIAFGTASLGFGIRMLVSNGTIGRSPVPADASVQDYDGQEDADG